MMEEPAQCHLEIPMIHPDARAPQGERSEMIQPGPAVVSFVLPSFLVLGLASCAANDEMKAKTCRTVAQ